MHLFRLSRLLRSVVPLALAVFSALTLGAQTEAQLKGKTLTLTIEGGLAPFAVSGTQVLTIDSPGNGRYTLDTNGTRVVSGGGYTYKSTNIGADLELRSYFSDGGTAQISLYNFNAATGAGRFETYTSGIAASNNGTFIIGTGAGSGGGTAPAITGSTSLTATVGEPFSYQVVATPAATSFQNMGGNATIAIDTMTGMVTGTFATAGTYTFSVKANNAAGSSATTTFTVTVTAPTVVPAPDIGALAGTYVGQQYFAMGNAAATALFGDFVATVTPGGVLSALGGTLTGRVDAQGNVSFDAGGATLAFGYTTGSIANGRLTAVGQVSANGVVLATYRIDAPRTGTGTGDTAAATVAPSNLVGYRNRVGQSFQFRVTGATSGAVWGTEVYTDDSSIARAAVHAGVLAVGETKVLTVSILPGRTSYSASTRHGVTSASWGGWHGSYAFAAAGVTTGGVTATAKPALAVSGDLPVSTLSAGGRLLLPIHVIGGGPYTYQWYLNGLAIAGATANPYVVESVGAAHAGTYSVDVTNALGTSRLSAGTVAITSVGAPVIALQPISRTVVPGGTFTLATNASGSGNTYQWYRNGIALSGETGAILLRQNVSASDAGDYTVRISNAAGSVTSNGGTVTLSANASRPANLSVRAHVAAGQSIIPGFFLQGIGTKRVIVRAVGSGLIPYGVTGTMADPKLEVYRGSTKVAESDNWDGSAATTAVFNSVGAFPLTAGSKDAALVTNLTAGQGYTVVVSGVANSSGVVLIEVYDADAAGTSTSTITNASVRGQAGSGSSTLILGFVIAGEGSRTLLVRGVGPKLASYGVTGALADPRLQIYDSSDRAVLANDNWGQADFVGELVQATDFLGTFRLDAGSKDAATLALLQPGAYTVHVSGAAGATGESLVEIYDVP